MALEERAQSETAAVTTHEIEIIDLIHQYKPHPLPHYLSQGTRQHSSKRFRFEEPGVDDSLPPARRARASFRLTSDQEHVHEFFTVDGLKGKSCDSFFEYVMASPAVQFDIHPGTVGRLYDLRFRKGLSIKHFRRVSFQEKLQNRGVETTDFTVAASNAPEPSSWVELGSTTRSFVDYSRAMCDAITIQVAEALDQLVSALEGWQQYEIAGLPLLVRRFDSLLRRYDGATAQDVFHLTATRAAAPSWFSISNPKLHSLMVTALAGRLHAAEAQSTKARMLSTRVSVSTSLPASEVSTSHSKRRDAGTT